ncbi:DNA-methyltransferase [Amycolatopsis sp. H20-H5]|uniref:DNA-methyltransferase n=1 Tax=Amycolatopsis sp. H20-H5 TaxID=3046309 RepID=UPI002DB845BC|nr:site-specific DNA-methyltransferase [Amycolatopsis sp. H20-H5]MEC3974355.1 site-specific DNA-methyltransferase [Amycolatopsis sp. H20-H5]
MNTSLASYHQQGGVTLYAADAQAGIERLPDNSVDCLVTSPPYWRLRDYAPDNRTGGRPACRHRPAGADTPPPESSSGRRPCRDCAAVRERPQIGLEPTAANYIDRLREVFAATRRVLTPRATVWINLGDSYSTNSDGYWCTTPGHPQQPRYRPPADVPHKNLLGMPWRLAFALQEDGWILRSAIVWHKPHTTPTPIRDRLATHHEMIFLFVTQPDYYFNLDVVRQPYAGDRALSRRAHHGGNKPNTARGTWPRTPVEAQRGRNPGNVWTIPPDRSRAGHPAPSPVEIPRRCIAAGCPEGGHVLDPFSGSASAGVAARELGRRFTGIDTNPEYHEIAKRRIAEYDQAAGGSH